MTTSSAPLRAVLVANRGEIAVRVISTLRRLGIRSIAVYSDADVDARHVREADAAVRIGPADARSSYLSIDAVVNAALRTGADAVHPGYGFLSENASFAAACDAAGLTFVGPGAAAIEVMGDKIAAKDTVSRVGVPVVPGISRPGLSDEDLVAGAAEVGFPVLIKPSAGGGGKGMRLVERASDLPAALAGARREAASSFGDDTMFLERFVSRPRHIEVQILADGHGNVVHLGERECSLQRRHQKVIEEAPSPLLDAATRATIGDAACATARSVEYTGAGTVEFIVSADSPDEFFFMEMNTRLQVEHPVTEMVTGIDLVEWQLRIAAGEPLGFGQDDVTLTGHAVETRVYAEDPAQGFLPTGGTVVGLREASGNGMRVDSGLAVGSVIGSNYDPMLSKVVAHGPNRAAALDRLGRALAETAVLGVVTNIEFARFLLADADVLAGRLDTGLLDRRAPDFRPAAAADEEFVAAAVISWLDGYAAGRAAGVWAVPSGWRVGARAPYVRRLVAGDRTVHVAISGTPDDATVTVDDTAELGLRATSTADPAGHTVTVVIDGLRRTMHYARTESGVWIAGPNGAREFRDTIEPSVRPNDSAGATAEITSPMPGTVIAIAVAAGETVSVGTAVLVVEAMKMEHTLTAPADGTVDLLVADGEQVRVGQVLARIIDAESGEESS